MQDSHSTTSEKHRGLSLVHLLEGGDGFAHIAVAVLLLLLAIGVLIAGTYTFVTDLLQLAHPSLSGKEAVAPGFTSLALTYLSTLLFGVIVLELLSTILTYIQSRNLEGTIKDFLVVGLISSIRKILLVGAQSSIGEKPSATDFINESIGTVISVICILLLIGGLLMLDRRKKLAAMESSVSE